MAGRVEIRIGDLFSERCDIIVLPSSRSGTITKRTTSDIEMYRIPRPRYRKELGETELIDLPVGHSTAKFVCWAASVASGTSSKPALIDIGARLAQYAETLPDIRIISAPLMGSGSGGLDKKTSVEGLAEGFLGRRPQSATLRLYERDRAISKGLQDLINEISEDFAIDLNSRQQGTLTGAQIDLLQRALLEAFSKDELEMMTRIELNVPLDTITLKTSLSSVVFDLILWAIRTNRVSNLVRGASNRNSTNLSLMNAAKSLGLYP